jgi:hypothetical protein
MFLPPGATREGGDGSQQTEVPKGDRSALASRIPLAASEVLARAFASRDAPKGTARGAPDELAGRVSTQRGEVRRFAGARASEHQEQALQLSRRAMETLARTNYLDFDDSGVTSADSVDGMHAEPAVANKP